MSVEEITSVFDFTGAIGSSSLMLLFPSLSYILVLREFGSSHERNDCETTFYLISAWIFLALYLLLMITYIYSFALNVVDPKLAPVQ